MKAIKYFTCIVLLALTSRIYSQIPDTIWTKTFGGPLADAGNSVKQTNDGGFIIAGTTSSFGAGGQDIWLIKTNENGDTVWTKTFGGTSNDRASNVVQTNDNGYAIFGTTNSYGNGGGDFLLWKTDSLGNTEWFKTYGGITNEVANEGQQFPDSSYVIVGDSVGQNTKAWLIKTDKYGNFIWGRTIGSDSYGVGYYGRSVQQTDDGRYAVGGIHSYLIYPPYYYSLNYFLSKVSSNGNIILIRNYEELGGMGVWGAIVKKLPDGNLILGGSIRQYSGGAEKPWIVKTNQNGDIIWDKIILGSQYPAVLTSIEPTNDNGFIFTIYGPNISLLKCDENGNLIWEKIVGGSLYDEAYSISQTNDEGFIVTGYTKSFGAGDKDIWIMKFNYPTPINVQINFFPPIDTAWIFGGCPGPDLISHNLISTPTRDSITIEPGLGSYFFYYDSLGNQILVDKYYFIVEDSLNQYNYELWFHPKSWPPFNPVQITFDSVFYFQQNSFDIQLIVKYNGSPIDSLSQFFRADWGLGVEETGEIPQAFSLSQNFPNPFNPVTSIQYAVSSRQFVSLKVYDILGNEIATLVNEEKQAGTYEVEFSPESSIKYPASGIYFYQLRAGDFIETKKMVLLK
ncbi:MAG: T9SS type A sorting domain-containing protein [Ignavibacteriaceae bacterium]|nr:T9SS type A sorting domain-containing protein [Ignavibacteriaceae bacterium]